MYQAAWTTSSATATRSARARGWKIIRSELPMANNIPTDLGIIKTLWGKDPNGSWAIKGLAPLTLKPQAGSELDFFPLESKLEMLTDRPFITGIEGWATTFGPTDFLARQSIVPVVAWVEGEPFIRCIGTGFVISCTGYIMTACHVILDPYESKYVKVERKNNSVNFLGGMRFGVLLPVNPAFGGKGHLFFPFHDCRCWGNWKDSALLHEEPRFEILTDIAICKIGLFPNGAGHQPLTLSLNSFTKGEKAIAIGYSEMGDIPVVNRDGNLTVPEFTQDLYVTVGQVKDLFPDNHQRREVPTPGPCFDFLAKVPGKMSGGPIFGAGGTVVRGVVSRSFSGVKHAYGAMIGPAINLPLTENTTFRTLMVSGNEGIAKVIGRGL